MSGAAAPDSVSVVIPVRDGAESLDRALASVRAQTHQPLETIVVDDGSTDGTAEVARRAGATVVAAPAPEGSGPARNRGVLAATGEWVGFLDSDDAWAPHHLETVLAAAHGASLVSASALTSDGKVRGNRSGSRVPLDPRRALGPDNIIVTSTVLVRRSTLIAAGLFRDLPRAQDLDLWVRVLELGIGVALPDVTITYEVSPRQETLGAHMANLVNVLELLSANVDKPWLTCGLHDGVIARMRWDVMRSAIHARSWAQSARQARWIARHPRAWPTLGRLYLLRRAAQHASDG